MVAVRHDGLEGPVEPVSEVPADSGVIDGKGVVLSCRPGGEVVVESLAQREHGTTKGAARDLARGFPGPCAAPCRPSPGRGVRRRGAGWRPCVRPHRRDR